ncbi:hypothetical protein [Pseudomonas sp. S2_B03]
MGAIFLLLAGISWAFVILHVKKHNWVSSPVALASWQMLLAAIPLSLAAYVMEGSPTQIPLNAERLGEIFFIGPAATSVCFVISAEYGRKISAFGMSNFTMGGAFNWHLIFLLLLRCTCFKCIFIGTFSHHVCVHPARPSCTPRQIEHRFHSGRSLPIKYFLTEIFEITTALALLNYRRIRAYYKIVNAQPNAYWKYSRAS